MFGPRHSLTQGNGLELRLRAVRPALSILDESSDHFDHEVSNRRIDVRVRDGPCLGGGQLRQPTDRVGRVGEGCKRNGIVRDSLSQQRVSVDFRLVHRHIPPSQGTGFARARHLSSSPKS